MKKLIDNSGGMKTFVELRPLTDPQHPGWMYLRLSTTWDNAKNPNNEQTKFDMCLTPEALATLKDFINEV